MEFFFSERNVFRRRIRPENRGGGKTVVNKPNKEDCYIKGRFFKSVGTRNLTRQTVKEGGAIGNITLHRGWDRSTIADPY